MTHLTRHVNASPRARSDSNSLGDLGKALRHNNIMRGSKPVKIVGSSLEYCEKSPVQCRRSVTFDDGRTEGHDGANEQPSCLRPLPRDAAVLGRRAEQLLAHVEDELAPRVRDS